MNPREQAFSECIQSAQNIGLNDLANAWKMLKQELFEDQIRIVILGEFNAGKSSLINALMDAPVVPAGVTPTTQIDTWIQYGETPQVRAYSATRCLQTWSQNAWKNLDNPAMPDALKTTTVDRLVIEQNPMPFHKNVVFIDTPGLNEALSIHDSNLQRHIHRANLILFILDANQPLTRTQQTQIAALQNALNPSQMALIVNKCDRLDNDEIKQIHDYILQTLAPIDASTPIFMLSAKKKSGHWRDFCLHLQSAVDSQNNQKNFNGIDRQIENMNRTLRAIQQIQPALRAMDSGAFFLGGQAASAMDFTANQREFTAEIQRLQRQTRSEIDNFARDFLQAMPRELDKATLNDIERYFENFIDDCFLECTKSLCKKHENALNALWHQTLRLCVPCDYPEFTIDFDWEQTQALLRTPTPTGAFDFNEAVGIWMLPLPGFISGRIERPRRDALKKMATTAIQLRAQQFKEALSKDLTEIAQQIQAFFNETRTCLPATLNALLPQISPQPKHTS